MQSVLTTCLLLFTVTCYASLPADNGLAVTRTVHLLILHEEASSLGLVLQPPGGPPGCLSEPELDTLVVKCRWWVTSDLFHSTLQQGRPLREQQEVAAAVIQRCYKKYKQVGTLERLCVRHRSYMLQPFKNQHLTNNLPCIYQLNWVNEC